MKDLMKIGNKNGKWKVLT